MLRRVFLENFVEFKEKQIINFEKNGSPNIFIGENGSGKSSFLEGIRRCLSSAASTSRSSVYDEQKSSYFVCKYDTSRCKVKYFEIESEYMFTGILTTADGRYYKFVSTSTGFFIDVYPNKGAPCQYQTEDTDFVQKINNEMETNTLNIDNFTKKELSELKDQKHSRVEDMLKKLESYVVLTLPLRSIGPLQWSKSDRIKEDERDKNYSEASERSEIIMYFLEHTRELGEDTKEFVEHTKEFDLEKENDYFTGLAGRNDIEFRLGTPLNGTQSIIVESDKTKLPGGKFALLKTPEGILEAKNFSILMSSKHFQTVILEEPEKGMHPQMIERMLAIIQSERTSKMIVLTTHNPCFVKPPTISQLTIFKRIRPPAASLPNKDSTEVISNLSHIFKEDKNKPKQNLSEPGMKTLRILTRDHLTEFIFAQRILFCEGDSDFLFLTALKEKIMRNCPGIRHVLKLLGDETGAVHDISCLQKNLVALQIININGWNNASKMHRLCEGLKVDDHYFVCDKDSIFENGKMKHDNRWLLGSDEYKTFVKKINEKQEGPSTEKWQENWEAAREWLRKECKCYSWRDGTLEDMAMSLLRSKTSRSDEEDTTHVGWTEKRKVIDELKQEFVVLPIHRWQERREKDRKKDEETEKLFLSKEVTQENITRSVEIFLKACEHKTDDLVQFVQFLYQMATV